MLDYQNLVNFSSLILFENREKLFTALKNDREAMELNQAKAYQECDFLMSKNKVIVQHFPNEISKCIKRLLIN